MKNHVQWLGGNPSEYEKVIMNSYQFGLSRPPSLSEIAYWKRQGIISYAMLVGCHEEWKKKIHQARKKHPVRQKTLPAPVLLAIVPHSAGITSEARTASGLTSSAGSNMVAVGGGN